MEKNKLKGVIIYTNTTCPYCKNIKDLFEKENIEFEERNTSEHQDEWGAILRLTGTPSVPTIEYQGEYFSPGRDFGNPKMLIDILSNYKPSTFSDSRRILEKVITLNFNFAQSINTLIARLTQLEGLIKEIKEQVINETEENVDKSTD